MADSVSIALLAEKVLAVRSDLRQPRALGRKVSDEFTVPVCRLHHREIHRHGSEAAWWDKLGIEPMTAALALWEQSHPTTSPLESAEDPTGKPSGTVG